MTMLVACDNPGCVSLPVFAGNETDGYQITKLGQGYIVHLCSRSCFEDFVRNHMDLHEAREAELHEAAHHH